MALKLTTVPRIANYAKRLVPAIGALAPVPGSEVRLGTIVPDPLARLVLQANVADVVRAYSEGSWAHSCSFAKDRRKGRQTNGTILY